MRALAVYVDKKLGIGYAESRERLRYAVELVDLVNHDSELFVQLLDSVSDAILQLQLEVASAAYAAHGGGSHHIDGSFGAGFVKHCAHLFENHAGGAPFLVPLLSVGEVDGYVARV